MLKNAALVILGVLFAAEMKNSYHDEQVKVYLLLTQNGEENVTLHPIVLSSNVPENITLKELLKFVPNEYKIEMMPSGIAADKGINDNSNYVGDGDESNNTKRNEELAEEKVEQNITLLMDTHANYKNRRFTAGIKTNNYTQTITLSNLEEKIPVTDEKSSHHKVQLHEEQVETNNRNYFKNDVQSNLDIDIPVSERIGRTHDVKDVYYVVHACSHRRCKIHEVVVLKRGIVQEDQMEAIFLFANGSDFSSDYAKGWKKPLDSEIIGFLCSPFRKMHWLLPVTCSVLGALFIKLICDVHTYKKKVNLTYVYMVECMSDMKEIADILKNYTSAQLLMEKRIMFACGKESDHETQIKSIQNEIAYLKSSVEKLDSPAEIDMDNFISTVLNYLEQCLESGVESSTDELNHFSSNALCQ